MSPSLAIPTVDLHVHLRGTMLPSVCRSMSRKNGVLIPEHRFKEHDRYEYSDFEDFLSCYDDVGRAVSSSADLTLLAESYLTRVANEGTIYAELMVSPDHSMENGIPYEEQIDGIAAGIDRARASTGIEAAIVITCVRHRGPDAAKALVNTVAKYPHPLVVGFGMTGNENAGEVSDFAEAFALAGETGLGLTAHSGEWRSAHTVVEAVDVLNLSRVGHGITVISDDRAVERLTSGGVGFEVCLSSNVVLRAVNSIRDHPVKRMLERGCLVTLSTDDPAFFETSPRKEAQLAEEFCALSAQDLRHTVINGIDMAFCPEAVKARLRRMVDAKDQKV